MSNLKGEGWKIVPISFLKREKGNCHELNSKQGRGGAGIWKQLINKYSL